MKKILLIIPLSFVLFCCGGEERKFNSELEIKMNEIAERYVKLVLRVGRFDPDYVDAYYGPAEWKDEVEKEAIEKDTLAYVKLNDEADELLNMLEGLRSMKASDDEILRYRFLYKQLLAVKGRIFVLRGGKLSFEEECRIFYDAEVPVKSTEYFKSVIAEINDMLPGSGDVSEKAAAFNKKFIIPTDKLDAVFKAAIEECRSRAIKNIQLPAEENFRVEYVTGKPWSGYNWYKGNSYSLIQVNTDLPIFIDRAIDLAAHEGYPGHHVYNTLLEKNMVRQNNWMEFTVYPLFGPQSLIAEGTANYGIKVAFPGTEREKFEKRVLFPIAGLDTSLVDKYYKLQDKLSLLDYTFNEAARNYLNGKWTREQALNYRINYGLVSPEKAERNMKFIDAYRSYVINYNLGKDIVERYIVKNGGTDNNPAVRWRIFEHIITTPQTPSGLR